LNFEFFFFFLVVGYIELKIGATTTEW